MAVDHQVQQMMEELSRALAEAIRASSEVSEAVRKIRHRGLSPHLLLSCQRGVELSGAASHHADGRGRDVEIAGGQDPSAEPAAQPVPGDAAFRLDGRDVDLLKSMGIDPTRSCRGHRRRGGRDRRRGPGGSTERRRGS